MCVVCFLMAQNGENGGGAGNGIKMKRTQMGTCEARPQHTGPSQNARHVRGIFTRKRDGQIPLVHTKKTSLSNFCAVCTVCAVQCGLCMCVCGAVRCVRCATCDVRCAVLCGAVWRDRFSKNWGNEKDPKYTKVAL